MAPAAAELQRALQAMDSILPALVLRLALTRQPRARHHTSASATSRRQRR